MKQLKHAYIIRYFEKSCIFLFNFAFVIRYISEMTPKEFEHKAKLMRAKALAVACRFLPEEEAEDVAQDVMLRLWAMHERIGANDPVERLVSLATQHACIDRLRLHHQEEDIEQSEAIVTEQNQHDALEYKELEEWLFRQIERLPSTCAIILKMRQLEHRELEEIATLMGITQTSVSTLLSRARHQLREELKRRNHD